MNLKQIETRMAEIREEMKKEDADIDALNKEVDDLIEMRGKLLKQEENRSALLAKIANGEAGEQVGITPAPIISEAEQRAKAFVETNRMDIDAAESRSLLLSSGTIATPTKVSGIYEGVGGKSSIVDMVLIEDCTGMSSDVCAYVDTESEASDGTEGSAAKTSEGTFGSVTIMPKLHSLISYVSNEITKQTPLNYTEKVKAQAVKALRRKAAKVITDAAISSEIAKEITDIAKIDDKTLRKIVLAHGADDAVEGDAVLFLKKEDLIAFGDVRGTNEKKAVYEIIPDGDNPDTGVIKDGGLSVRYCINPYCMALTNTAAGKTKIHTMFYGNPYCIKLDLFGAYTIKTSEEYKFAEGLLSVLGSATFGAGLIVKNGVTIVTIPVSSS